MRRTALRRAAPILALVLLLLPPSARAQVTLDTDLPVALIADEVVYDSETGRVTASGDVEVYYGDRTLTADRIIYDDTTGRIAAEGELVLRDPGGATVFADAADLDVELRDGIVSGARSVIAGNVKLAAVEARRVGGRYNALAKAVYSPCIVCPTNPTPLWSIRARRVIHDEVENIIHYENATFLVFGVPVAWLPYFRHPDPTVERASGFLVPSFLSSSIFGYGLKVPYYWVIDPYSDLTVRPFLTTNDGPLLELEYRRMFRTGAASFGGSVTWNDYQGDGDIHGFVETEGLFDVGGGFDAGWDITVASDDAFLRRFEYDYGDRLTSELFLRRYRQDSFLDVSALRFQSLRPNEPAGQIPIALPVMEARWELDDPLAGGEFGLFTSSYILERSNGRDATRLTLGADWEREEVLPVGLSVTGFAQLRGDLYSVDDDPTIADSPTARMTGHAGLELRYPLIWDDAPDRAVHLIEPVLQAIAAPYGHNGPSIPVEDSRVTVFDELNVIDRNHFSGIDSFEEGPRLNALLRYERIIDDGLRFDTSVGRVFRLDEVTEFSTASGLRDETSDWVAAWQASWDPYAVVRHRMRFDDDLSLAHNEFFGALDLAPVELTAAYGYFQADPAIGSPTDREEVSGSAGLQIDPNWSISALAQRDLEQDEWVVLGGQLTFENECAGIDLFLRRRFTDLVDAPASTTFGVNVRLLTLGTSNLEPPERRRGLLDRTLLGLGGGGCG